jgi:hypothetical protein
MAYDPDRKRVVMTGGPNLTDQASHAATWEWDGVQWHEYSDSGAPYGEVHLFHGDPYKRTILVHPGQNVDQSADLWCWNPTAGQWSVVPGGDGPAGRGGATIAYDGMRKRVVLFGGGYNPGEMLYFDDLWEWGPAGWSRHGANIPWPAGRLDSAMAFDSSRNRLLLFGGANNSGMLGDLWELELR